MNLQEFEALTPEEKEAMLKKLETEKTEKVEKPIEVETAVNIPSETDLNVEVDTTEVDKVQMTADKIKAIVEEENKRAAILSKIESNEFMKKSLTTTDTEYSKWDLATLERSVNVMEQSYSQFKPVSETPIPKKSRADILNDAHKAYEIAKGYRKEAE